MKKILCLLLTIAIPIFFAGCSDENLISGKYIHQGGGEYVEFENDGTLLIDDKIEGTYEIKENTANIKISIDGNEGSLEFIFNDDRSSFTYNNGITVGTFVKVE